MTQMPASAPAPALLRRFDVPVTDYATYPAPDRYAGAFGPQDCLRALRRRGRGAVVGGCTPLAIRLHVPSCGSTGSGARAPVVTPCHGRAADPVAAFEREIELAAAALGTRQSVARVHVGGGAPWSLSDGELARVDRALRQAFRLAADADLSIEVDARLGTPMRLAHLRALGFGRLGLSLQGFDPQEQASERCVPSLRAVRTLVEAARSLGFAAVHVDLVFGLPGQTPPSFARTLGEVLELAPDRIALSPCAHGPLRHDAARRRQMLATGIDGLLRAGHAHLGLMEFARAADPLLGAMRQGRLQRDLLGYGTRADGDVLALGASAAGRLGTCHYQNDPAPAACDDALRRGELPVARGLVLTRDELVRRAVIMAIVCQGQVDFEAISLSHLVDMRRHFARELAALEPFVCAGLVERDAEGFQLTPAGAWFAAGVARVFDRAPGCEADGEPLAGVR